MAENIRPPDDSYARGSFTWRRMTPTQLWSITIVAAVVIIAAIFYGVSM